MNFIASAGPAAWEKLATGLEIDKSSIAPSSTIVKTRLFSPSCGEGLARRRPLPAPSKRLPRCLTNHHAAPSIVKLFEEWIQEADQTDNSIISINLRHQSYSHTTVTKAVNWLILHHLLMKADGRGRDQGVRYLLRWSFIYGRHAANCGKERTGGNPDVHLREGALKPSEKSKKQELSLSNDKTAKAVKPDSPISSKAQRWAMSRIREAMESKCASPQLGGRTRVSPAFAGSAAAAVRSRADGQRQRLKPYITAFAKIVRRVIANGSVRLGPELGDFVRGFVAEISWNFRWETDSRAVSAFIEGLAVAEINGARIQREAEAERRARIRQQREAEAHPVAELLQQEQVGSISDLVRKLVQKEV